MGADTFPLDEAQIVGLFMESILYGAYVVSLIFCLRILLFENRTINKILLSAAVLMAIFATLDVALGLRHNLVAFILYRGPGGPNGEFEDISYWVNVMKTVDYVIQTLIGDLILIYRCYIVYGRRWSTILVSVILWVASIVCASAVIYIEVHLKIDTNLDQKELVPFITATIVLSITQNLLTTGLIARRLWAVDKSSQMYLALGNRSLRQLSKIILESGAVYTANQVVFLIVYLSSNNAQYGVSDCTVQITGIVFNVIIARVHQGRTIDQATTTATSSTSSTIILSKTKTQRIASTPVPRRPSRVFTTSKISDLVFSTSYSKVMGPEVEEAAPESEASAVEGS